MISQVKYHAGGIESDDLNIVLDHLRRDLPGVVIVKADQLYTAFQAAEQETAEQYGGQTCGMLDKDEKFTCPICYFRQRVKAHLGL